MNSPWENSEAVNSEQIVIDHGQSAAAIAENGAASLSVTNASAPPPPAAPKPAEEAGAGNVDKIRDILFGSHMRDYEARFTRLEQTLAQESAELRETTRKRLDDLEAFVKNEIDALHARFKSERDERSVSVTSLAGDLRGLADALHRKIADVDDHHSATHHELREQLLQHGRDINDQIMAKQREVTSLLEQRFHELHSGKTDRAALASLFNEVALRLNNEFKVPSTTDH
jgi:hypothetical protein